MSLVGARAIRHQNQVVIIIIIIIKSTAVLILKVHRTLLTYMYEPVCHYHIPCQKVLGNLALS